MRMRLGEFLQLRANGRDGDEIPEAKLNDVSNLQGITKEV